ENLKVQTINNEDMHLGYRTSVFKNKKCVITSVTFKLKKGNEEDIRLAMDDYMERRKSKQPLEYPSAGSTFKRPEGYFAGALIEKNGLKGKSVGGAMVSEKHAGFLINYSNATSDDVKSLMKIVADTVFEADGVKLEPEVIFVGRE
ncbi:MAG: UDP-N-acetylenolpyruvoylglucosamine reductase, partial [Clostridia bacterium]|nr:UDP-N-acetylenolpyruvoylglucosamine reductase [Clostridia bacterium]